MSESLKQIKIKGIASKKKIVESVINLSNEVNQWVHLQKEGSDIVAIGSAEGIKQFEAILKRNKVEFSNK